MVPRLAKFSVVRSTRHILFSSATVVFSSQRCVLCCVNAVLATKLLICSSRFRCTRFSDTQFCVCSRNLDETNARQSDAKRKKHTHTRTRKTKRRKNFSLFGFVLGQPDFYVLLRTLVSHLGGSCSAFFLECDLHLHTYNVPRGKAGRHDNGVCFTLTP